MTMKKEPMTMDALQDLFYEVRKRFYELDLNLYCEARSELNRLAAAAGLNENLVVQTLIIKEN